MNKTTHLIAGVTVGILLSSHLELEPLHTLLCVTASTLGSLLPDLDTPSSWLGRRLLLISYPISKLFGHRTITHSILLWTILFIIYPVFYQGMSHGVFCYGVYGGVISHLLLDLISPVGIPVFYPFGTRLHLLPSVSRYSRKHSVKNRNKNVNRKRLPI